MIITVALSLPLTSPRISIQSPAMGAYQHAPPPHTHKGVANKMSPFLLRLKAGLVIQTTVILFSRRSPSSRPVLNILFKKLHSKW